MTKKPDKEYIKIKREPEIRHVLAHLYMAIDSILKNCPLSAIDNIQSIEGLIFYDGLDPTDWEKYHKGVIKMAGHKKKRKKKRRHSGCSGR